MNQKQLEIIHTAIRLFSEKGYSATSVEEIAKESSIAKPSLYKYFQSKEDILLECLLLLDRAFKQGSRQMSLNSDLPSKEKLNQLILIFTENIFNNKIHLLMFTAYEIPAFQNEKLSEAKFALEKDITLWSKECFLDIYGRKIENYVWDLVSIMKGMMFEYIRAASMHGAAIQHQKIAAFIANVIDDIACGMLEQKYEPLLTFKALNWGIERTGGSLYEHGTKIANLLAHIEEKVKGLSVDSKAKEEYLQVVKKIKEELTKKEKEDVSLKAFVLYLEQVAELQKECKKLREMMEIT
jgi:AcrR family transcriptional regulator